jgi:hypothetical protein
MTRSMERLREFARGCRKGLAADTHRIGAGRRRAGLRENLDNPVAVHYDEATFLWRDAAGVTGFSGVDGGQTHQAVNLRGE